MDLGPFMDDLVRCSHDEVYAGGELSFSIPNVGCSIPPLIRRRPIIRAIVQADRFLQFADDAAGVRSVDPEDWITHPEFRHCAANRAQTDKLVYLVYDANVAKRKDRGCCE